MIGALAAVPKVLCTLPMHKSGDALLASHAQIVVAPDTSADTFRRMIGDADYLLVRNHLPADLLDRPHRLRGIVRNGTGLDMIPVAAATAQWLRIVSQRASNAALRLHRCTRLRRLPRFATRFSTSIWFLQMPCGRSRTRAAGSRA